MDEKKKFAKNLRRIRKASGISQEQLAEKINRSPETISHLERGVNQPTLETIIRIKNSLGIPWKDLLGTSLNEQSSDPERNALLIKLNEAIILLDNEKVKALLDNAKTLIKISK